MWPLLADPALHAFTGGRPPTRDELGQRYVRQARGRSPDGRQRWLNWIVRRRSDGVAVGFVQATIPTSPAAVAELAWTIASPFQGLGYAKDAAAAMARWITEHEGIAAFQAHIRPDHDASAGVARSLGLVPTGRERHGETLWVTGRPAPR